MNRAHATVGCNQLLRLLACAVVICALGLLGGCADTHRRPLAQSIVPQPELATAHGALDPAPADDSEASVAAAPTPADTAEASKTPFPEYADVLRAKWGRQTFSQATTGGNVVALTFDDGPSDNLMVMVTDALDQAGAKATFFCVGSRVKRRMGEVTYAYKHGMELDNHTWSHVSLNSTRRADDAQILAADNVIAEITGTRPLWVRPRSGIINAEGEAAVFDSGHLLAGWDVHASDIGTETPDEIALHTLTFVRPGAVVDLHVTNPNTLRALPTILNGLVARGYRMVTLSELAMPPK